MQVRRDVVFAERDGGPLLLDLVLPEAPRPAPVVLWLHGGGWFTGDRRMAPDLHRYFAARGFAMACAEYRLSGQARFPAQLHDVRAAIRFLRREAGRFGLDPAAIGLWGSSAGGHLAALAGVCGHRERLPGEPESGPAQVAAVAEGYGPVDLAAVVDGAQVSLGGEPPESRLLGGPPAELPELARAASPLTHITPAAPPFQIAHGTADVLVPPRQSELLHEALRAAGVESAVHFLPGFRHGFLNPAADFDRPDVMDSGRLAAEPVEAAFRRAAPGTPEVTGRAVFSFDTIGDFFARHLTGGRA